MRTALATGVACGLVVLSGCSSSDSTTPTLNRPILSDARVATVLKGAGENTKFLFDSEQQLIARCMHKLGYEYVPETQEQDGIPNPFREGLTLADAQREGYGLRHALASAKATKHPNDDTIAGLSKSEARSYAEALAGARDTRISVKIGDSTVSAPGSGCIADARKAIYGDLKKEERLSYVSRNVLAEASQTVESDDNLIDARKKWSRCMAKAGYHYDSRRKARASLGKRYSAKGADVDAVFRDEIATATADAKCSQQTGFDTALRKAQDHASAVAVTRHEADLVAAHELNQQAVTRAKKALANP